MNKQQILEQIDELKQKIEELEKEVNSPEFEGIKKGVRQKPEYGEKYYYLDDGGGINYAYWSNDNIDLCRFSTGNCFNTKQEAEEYKENLLTKQALKDLALELNNGVEVDWKSGEQDKHYLYLDHQTNALSMYWVRVEQYSNIHCLNPTFLIIAKERIGEEKLIKLIKSGV